MKTYITLIVLIITSSLSRAQEKDLVGTWNIIGSAYTTINGTDRIMEDQIRSGNTIDDILLMEDGNLKEISNSSGSATPDTFKGTWNLSGDKLLLTLNINDRPVKFEWKYNLSDDILILSRTNPAGTLTIANTFRKKEVRLTQQP